MTGWIGQGAHRVNKLGRLAWAGPVLLDMLAWSVLLASLVAAAPPPNPAPPGQLSNKTPRQAAPDPCLVTYTAFQPNVDVFTEKVAEITRNRCKPRGVPRSRRKHKGKGNRKKRKSIRRRKPRTKSGRKKNKRSNKKNKKLFHELKAFRRWKSLVAGSRLLLEPRAQEAVTELWLSLFSSGDQWRRIYEEMHEVRPVHVKHCPPQPAQPAASPTQTTQ